MGKEDILAKIAKLKAAGSGNVTPTDTNIPNVSGVAGMGRIGNGADSFTFPKATEWPTDDNGRDEVDSGITGIQSRIHSTPISSSELPAGTQPGRLIIGSSHDGGLHNALIDPTNIKDAGNLVLGGKPNVSKRMDSAIDQTLREASEINNSTTEEHKGNGGLFSGFDALDTFTGGFAETSRKNSQLIATKEIAKKVKAGVALSTKEQLFVDAIGLRAKADELVQKEGGQTTGYQVGKTVGAMPEFIGQIMLTAPVGSEVGTVLETVPWLAKGIKAGAPLWRKGLSLAGIELGKAAVVSPLQSMFASNFADQELRQYSITTDKDGNVVADKNNPQGVFTSLWKAYAQTLTENWSEGMGEILGKTGAKVAQGFVKSKLGVRMAGSQLGTIIARTDNAITKGIGGATGRIGATADDFGLGGLKAFTKDVMKWHGTLNEIAEEEFNNVVQPLLMGEPDQLKQLLDPKQQLVTALSCAVAGVGFKAVEIPGYVQSGIAIKQNKDAYQKNLSAMQPEVAAKVAEAFGEQDLEARAGKLSTLPWETMDPSEKERVVNAAYHRTRYDFLRGAKVASDAEVKLTDIQNRTEALVFRGSTTNPVDGGTIYASTLPDGSTVALVDGSVKHVDDADGVRHYYTMPADGRKPIITTADGIRIMVDHSDLQGITAVPRSQYVSAMVDTWQADQQVADQQQDEQDAAEDAQAAMTVPDTSQAQNPTQELQPPVEQVQEQQAKLPSQLPALIPQPEMERYSPTVGDTIQGYDGIVGDIVQATADHTVVQYFDHNGEEQIQIYGPNDQMQPYTDPGYTPEEEQPAVEAQANQEPTAEILEQHPAEEVQPQQEEIAVANGQPAEPQGEVKPEVAEPVATEETQPQPATTNLNQPIEEVSSDLQSISGNPNGLQEEMNKQVPQEKPVHNEAAKKAITLIEKRKQWLRERINSDVNIPGSSAVVKFNKDGSVLDFGAIHENIFKSWYEDESSITPSRKEDFEVARAIINKFKTSLQVFETNEETIGKIIEFINNGGNLEETLGKYSIDDRGYLSMINTLDVWIEKTLSKPNKVDEIITNELDNLTQQKNKVEQVKEPSTSLGQEVEPISSSGENGAEPTPRVFADLAKSIASTVNDEPSVEEPHYVSKNRSTLYTVKDGELLIMDRNGVEIPRMVNGRANPKYTKLANEYRRVYDYTKGELGTAESATDEQQVLQQVIDSSRNPAELVLLHVSEKARGNALIEELQHGATHIILTTAQGMKLDASTLRKSEGDVNQVGSIIARVFFARKGEGVSLDQIASAASAELNDSYGIDATVTPEDVWQAITSYPNGVTGYEAQVKSDTLAGEAAAAFERITGFAITPTVLAQVDRMESSPSVVSEGDLERDMSDSEWDHRVMVATQLGYDMGTEKDAALLQPTLQQNEQIDVQDKLIPLRNDIQTTTQGEGQTTGDAAQSGDGNLQDGSPTSSQEQGETATTEPTNGERSEVALTPTQQAEYDRRKADIGNDISELTRKLVSARKSKSKAIAEANNRNGLFGDTATDPNQASIFGGADIDVSAGVTAIDKRYGEDIAQLSKAIEAKKNELSNLKQVVSAQDNLFEESIQVTNIDEPSLLYDGYFYKIEDAATLLPLPIDKINNLLIKAYRKEKPDTKLTDEQIVENKGAFVSHSVRDLLERGGYKTKEELDIAYNKYLGITVDPELKWALGVGYKYAKEELLSEPTEVQFPLKKVADSYGHLHLNPSNTAKVEREQWNTLSEELRNTIKQYLPNIAEKQLDEIINKYKSDYITAREGVWRAASVAYSSARAGGSNFNVKQANQRGTALDAAEARFGEWLNKEHSRIEETLGITRIKEEEAQKKQASNEQAKQGAKVLLVKKWMSLKVGDEVQIGNPNGNPKIAKKNQFSVVTNGGAKWTLKELFGIDHDEAKEIMDELQAAEKPAETPANEQATKANEEETPAAPAIGSNEAVRVEQEAAFRAKLPFYTQALDNIKRLYHGELTLEQYKQAFNELQSNKDTIIEELGGNTKDVLLALMGSYERYQYKNEKKERIVKVLYQNLLMEYAFNSISYDFSTPTEVAIARKVEKTTQNDLTSFAENVKRQHAERKKEQEAKKKALENPETLEEFRIFISKNGIEALNDEQLKTFDKLRTQAALKQKAERKAEPAKADPVAVSTEGLTLHETKHTKTGDPLFVVQLPERVSKEEYQTYNSRAKSLGGYYSSYRGNGAIPGFTFKSKEQAADFMGGAESRTENEETQEPAAPTAHKLREQGEKVVEAANEALNHDRLTNTVKRAREAEYADSNARKLMRIGQTMINIANAVEAGEAVLVGNVKAKTHVELLESILASAKWRLYKDKEKSSSYKDREAYLNADPTEEVLRYVQNDYLPKIYKDNLLRMVRTAINVKGMKQQAARWEKGLTAFSGEYFTPKNEQQVEELTQLVNALPEKERVSVIEDQMANHRRLKAMGVENESMLRELLREYLKLRATAVKEDEVKKLERELVGMNVGFDFFPTPKVVVDRMVDEADIREGMDVLEPSAGNGNIADGIRETGVEPDVVELSSALAKVLEAKGYNVVGNDFIDFNEKKYDRIVMNPPFSNGMDGEHIRHAYDLLKPGGRIVAISGEGIFFRSDKKSVEFRNWLESIGGNSERLPEGTFTDKTLLNTTGANTRLLVIEKPEENPAFSKTKQLPKTITVEGVERPTANSNGKPIHGTAEGVVNFWRWFGDSKVVDEQGRPIVVYHGTRRKFDEFSANKPGGAINEKGIYFGDKETAEEYAMDNDGAYDKKSRVVAAYIKIANDSDGRVIDNSYTGREYVVYKATNIKSATGNSGEFDGSNANITYSRSQAVTTTSETYKLANSQYEQAESALQQAKSKAEDAPTTPSEILSGERDRLIAQQLTPLVQQRNIAAENAADALGALVAARRNANDLPRLVEQLQSFTAPSKSVEEVQQFLNAIKEQYPTTTEVRVFTSTKDAADFMRTNGYSDKLCREVENTDWNGVTLPDGRVMVSLHSDNLDVTATWAHEQAHSLIIRTFTAQQRRVMGETVCNAVGVQDILTYIGKEYANSPIWLIGEEYIAHRIGAIATGEQVQTAPLPLSEMVAGTSNTDGIIATLVAQILNNDQTGQRQGDDFGNKSDNGDTLQQGGDTGSAPEVPSADSGRDEPVRGLPADNQERVDAAQEQTDTNPTEAQKEAGNYRKGKARVMGMEISIENPEGSTRSGVDPSGKEWSITMPYPYGYILGTVGNDKDHVDVYLGRNLTKDTPVFIVNQVNPSTGAFDEHKVMMGFPSYGAAKRAYMSAYEKGWNGFGSMGRMSIDEFRQWTNDRVDQPAPAVEATPELQDSRDFAEHWHGDDFLGIPTDFESALAFARNKGDVRVASKEMDTLKGSKVDEFRENKQDATLRIRRLQETIEGEGGRVPWAANAWEALNRYTSAAKARMDYFEKGELKALVETAGKLCKKIDATWDELGDYLLAKHGIERQEIGGVSAFSDEPGAEWTLDNAKSIVADFEAKASPADITNLWSAIHSSTTASLSALVRGGMISQNDMDSYLSRPGWQNYVPLRDFEIDDENEAKSVFEYNETDHKGKGTFVKATQTAKGRHSKPMNPIPQIAAMFASSVAISEKNFAKQHLLNLVRLNPKRAEYTVAKSWFVLDSATNTSLEVFEKPKQSLIDLQNACLNFFGESDLTAKNAMVQSLKDLEDKATQDGADPSLIHLVMRQGMKEGVTTISAKQHRSSILGETNEEERQHIVEVFEDGVKYTIWMQDANLASAANHNNINDKFIKTQFGQVMAGLNRWLSVNFTGKNPAFIPINWIRDVQYATLSHLIRHDGEAARTAANMGRASSAIHRSIRNTAKPLTEAEMAGMSLHNPSDLLHLSNTFGKKRVIDTIYQQYRLNGAETGYIHTDDVKQWAKRLRRALEREMGTNPTLDKIKRAGSKYTLMRGLGRLLDYTAYQSENMTRFATFLSSWEQGKGFSECASDAKNITVNFNRKGRDSGWINSLVVFFNASVQGSDNLIDRVILPNKARFTAAASLLFAASITASMMAMSAYGDDDDNPYWRMPEYVRYNSIVIPTYGIGGGEKYLMIPLPPGLRFINGWAVAALDGYYGRKTPAQVGGSMASSVIDNFSPIGVQGGDLARSIVPSTAVPFYDIAINKDYAGRNVYREMFTPEMRDNTPNSQQGNRNVNEAFAWFASTLNKLGGGSDNVPAGTDVATGRENKVVRFFTDHNPSKIEHVLTYYAGGRGQFFLDCYKTVRPLWDKEQELEIRNIPVVRRLVGESNPASDAKAFYERVDNLQRYNYFLESAFKNRDPEAVKQSITYADVPRWAEMAKVYSRQIRELASTAESKGVTLEQRKGLLEQRRVLMRQFLNHTQQYDKPEENLAKK